jgi:tRNA dimethylallyltransferase
MSFDFASNSWFLTGATATGKSAVAVELARRIDAEIISLDSMALYRGMDIGTAKPTLEERWSIPHHLIDVLEPHEEYSLAQYVEAAERCTAEIRSRGRQVLFVGGTPLYLKGLLRGIFEGPAADWEFRHRLTEQAQQNDAQWLHRQVAAIDPAAASRLHANDTRRLIRALEVFEKTGQPISTLQGQFEVGRPAAECRVFVLDWSKEELHARIERRVDAMFAAGLVEEVRGLLEHSSRHTPCADIKEHGKHPVNASSAHGVCGIPLSRTARQAVGYREVIEHLEGRCNLAETIELVQQHTRQLAKRQGTWFRSLSECRFVAVSEPMDAGEVAEGIAKEGRRPGKPESCDKDG